MHVNLTCKSQLTYTVAYAVGDQGAFAMTSTVNTYFGSLVVSNTTGIIFNNQMDDFSTPGVFLPWTKVL